LSRAARGEPAGSQPAPDQPARTSSGHGIPIPSDRAAFVSHLIALAILVGETAYWLPQPCSGGGDVLGACASIFGLFTGGALVPVAIGVALWRMAGRASALVLVDAFLLAFLVPVAPIAFTSAGPIDPMWTLLSPGLALILLFGILGPIADLGAHRMERRLSIAGTVALAIVLLPTLIFAVVPALIALLLVLAQPVRSRVERI
jgi:hypothetical protein